MANVLSDEKRQQVLALGRLKWPLRRIEEATGTLVSIAPAKEVIALRDDRVRNEKVTTTVIDERRGKLVRLIAP